MEQTERQRQQRVQHGENPAEVDRDAAQIALTGVVAFFQDQGIESEPLVRLLGDLTALTAGASPAPMLAPSATRHRRPDAPTIEGLKGRLAAIMECRQEIGLTRKAAGEWVVRHAPEKLKRRLRLASRPTVDGWLAKWGGQRGAASGDGREGYLQMRAVLEQQRPPEQQLKKVMEGHLAPRHVYEHLNVRLPRKHSGLLIGSLDVRGEDGTNPRRSLGNDTLLQNERHWRVRRAQDLALAAAHVSEAPENRPGRARSILQQKCPIAVRYRERPPLISQRKARGVFQTRPRPALGERILDRSI